MYNNKLRLWRIVEHTMFGNTHQVSTGRPIILITGVYF